MEGNRFKTRLVDLVNSNDKSIMDINLTSTPSLPLDIQRKVYGNWERFLLKKVQKNEPAVDGRVLFLQDWERSHRGIEGKIFIDGYSKVAYINRSMQGESYFDRIVSGEIKYGVPFTTWGVPTTTDGKAVFAFKVGVEYETKSVSAFGGIAIESDIEDGKINMPKLIERTLGYELGKDLWVRRNEVNYHGMCLALRSATRDQHTSWSFDLDVESREVQEKFSKNPQFKNNLIFVDNTLEGLYGFMTGENWKPTAVCVGGVSTYVLSNWGENEGNAWLEEYQQNPRSTIVELDIR
jgi:hypothetical protein